MSESNSKKIIVTTSWDDGHPMDIRLAELLCSYNVLGTFYIPLNCQDHPVVTKKELHILRNIGMEIGSHTLNNTALTKIETSQLIKELTVSTDILENILGEPILSFGYPEGKFNRTVCLWLKKQVN